MKNLSLIKILNLLIIIYFSVFNLGFNINLTLASQAPSNQGNQNSVEATPSQNNNSPSGATGSETGLVKCGVSRDCTICDIFILVRDIFNFALGLLAALAVVSIVIGGVYIVTSAGDSGRAREGYSIITNAVIGLLLVMASFLFFSFALVSLGFQSANFSAVLDFQDGQIFSVKCDNASTFNDRGQNGGGLVEPGQGGSGNVGSLNVACLDATNLDENISAVMRTISFYEGAADRSGYFRLVGGKMYAQSQNVHPGADNPNLYRTTGFNSDAYGRFQMLSTTWGEWASKAGVPTSKPGTYTVPEGTFAYYNMSPQYQDAAVANILKSKGIKDCQSFKSNSFKCQWASIAGCSQSNPKTTQYPFDATCAKMLEDEKTGACK